MPLNTVAKLGGSTLHQYPNPDIPVAQGQETQFEVFRLLQFKACCLKHASVFMGYCNRCLQQNHPGQHGKGKEVMA